MFSRLFFRYTPIPPTPNPEYQQISHIPEILDVIFSFLNNKSLYKGPLLASRQFYEIAQQHLDPILAITWESNSLSLFVKYGNIDTIRTLIDKRGCIKMYRNLFFAAIEANRVEILDVVLEKNIQHMNPNPITNTRHIVYYLDDQWSDSKHKAEMERFYWTHSAVMYALWFARKHNNPEILKCILKYPGVEPLFGQDYPTCTYQLHLLLVYGKAEIFKVVMQDPRFDYFTLHNQTLYNASRPWRLGLFYGPSHLKIVEMLLNNPNVNRTMCNRFIYSIIQVKKWLFG